MDQPSKNAVQSSSYSKVGFFFPNVATSVQFLWIPNFSFPVPFYSFKDVCQQKEAALLGLLDGLQRERSSHLQLQTAQSPQRGCGEERDV